MLSVLAFKRSLAAGILDGGASEILLGGSRLTRFMKDVENVTGRMGESEVMAAVEEAASGAVMSGNAAREASVVETDLVGAGERRPQALTVDTAQRGASFEPWSELLQFGAVLASALSEPGDVAVTHPWVERDAVTGERSLRLPLPSPETARRLADVLSTISDALLRSGSANRSR